MFDQIVRRLRRRGDVHTAVSVNSGREGRVSATSSARIEPEEAERQDGDVLPERQAMSVINPSMYGNPPVPILEEPLGLPPNEP